MRYIILKNRELFEPICFDEEGNALNAYDPKYDTHPETDILIYENGYAYARLKGEKYFQDGYCMSGQNLDDYEKGGNLRRELPQKKQAEAEAYLMEDFIRSRIARRKPSGACIAGRRDSRGVSGGRR